MFENVRNVEKIGETNTGIPIYGLQDISQVEWNAIARRTGGLVMNGLMPIEHQSQRILTSELLAYQYGTTTQIITNNYNRNRQRYTEGKHYYCLEGAAKREFINLTQIDLGSKNAKSLYLWTEKGALLHAKSLNTDKAWEVYDMLVDTYFRAKQQQIQATPPQTEITLTEQLIRLVTLLERQIQPSAAGVPVLPEPIPEPEKSYMAQLRERKMLTKAEAANYIGISVKTLNSIMEKQDFPAMTRIGFGRGRVFINREKLDQWINEQDGSYKAVL